MEIISHHFPYKPFNQIVGFYFRFYFSLFVETITGFCVWAGRRAFPEATDGEKNMKMEFTSSAVFYAYWVLCSG